MASRVRRQTRKPEGFNFTAAIRPVIEDMSKVRTATAVHHLGTYHTVAFVDYLQDGPLFNGLIKTWPPGTRLKLML